MPPGQPDAYPPGDPRRDPNHPIHGLAGNPGTANELPQNQGLTPAQKKKNQQNRRQGLNPGRTGQGPATPPGGAGPATPGAQGGQPPTANFGGQNIYAGEEGGRPFYIAGYDQNFQPQFTWNPTFVPTEFAGPVNRDIGHFQDATQSGGQAIDGGGYLSNAQGSMYQTDPNYAKLPPNLRAGSGVSPLVQTGTYPVADAVAGAGQPAPPTGPGINPGLTGGQAGVPNRSAGQASATGQPQAQQRAPQLQGPMAGRAVQPFTAPSPQRPQQQFGAPGQPIARYTQNRPGGSLAPRPSRLF